MRAIISFRIHQTFEGTVKKQLTWWCRLIIIIIIIIIVIIITIIMINIIILLLLIILILNIPSFMENTSEAIVLRAAPLLTTLM